MKPALHSHFVYGQVPMSVTCLRRFCRNVASEHETCCHLPVFGHLWEGGRSCFSCSPLSGAMLGARVTLALSLGAQMLPELEQIRHVSPRLRPKSGQLETSKGHTTNAGRKVQSARSITSKVQKTNNGARVKECKDQMYFHSARNLQKFVTATKGKTTS